MLSAAICGSNDRRSIAVDKLATKSRRQVIKLPWEVTTYYTNFLAGHAAKRRRLASSTGAPTQDDDDAEDEDEDDMEANEDLLTRLRVRRVLLLGAAGTLLIRLSSPHRTPTS